MCKLRAKAWCLAAGNYNRKRRHLRFIPDDVEDADAIEAGRIDEGPDRDAVVPDGVLDEVGEPEPSSPSYARLSAARRVTEAAASSGS